MVYEWKDRAYAAKKMDAQACGERIERITKAHKGAMAQKLALIADGRSKSSPLHLGFTWDNDAAAEKCRLDEAGYLLRSIVIVQEEVTDDEGEPKTIRAFLSVEEDEDDESDDTKTYVNVYDAMSDPRMRQQVLKKAYEELLVWKARYEQFEEFAKVTKAISSIKPPGKKPSGKVKPQSKKKAKRRKKH